MNVNLGQLWEYSHKPLGRQPFYAFPRPDWDGDLAAVARAQQPRKEVTELAFRRSGSGTRRFSSPFQASSSPTIAKARRNATEFWTNTMADRELIVRLCPGAA